MTLTPPVVVSHELSYNSPKARANIPGMISAYVYVTLSEQGSGYIKVDALDSTPNTNTVIPVVDKVTKDYIIHVDFIDATYTVKLAWCDASGNMLSDWSGVQSITI